MWQMRAMMQPVAIMATVPKPNSSAPRSAHMDDVEPRLEAAVGAEDDALAQVVLDERLVRLDEAHLGGPPACLIEVRGDAPVPPSPPEIWMMSAFAFATPDATVPMPAWPTSFTETFALGLTMWRS